MFLEDCVIDKNPYNREILQRYVTVLNSKEHWILSPEYVPSSETVGFVILESFDFDCDESERVGRGIAIYHWTMFLDRPVVFGEKLSVSLSEILDCLGFSILRQDSCEDSLIRSFYRYGLRPLDAVIVYPQEFKKIPYITRDLMEINEDVFLKLKRLLKTDDVLYIRKILRAFNMSFFEASEYVQLSKSVLEFETEEGFMVFPPGWKFFSDSQHVGKGWILDEFGRERFELIFGRNYSQIIIISPLCRITISEDLELFFDGIFVVMATYQKRNTENKNERAVICYLDIDCVESDYDLAHKIAIAKGEIEKDLNETYPNWENPNFYWDENGLLGQ